MEGSGRGLRGTVPAFTCRAREKPQKPQDSLFPDRDLDPGPPEYDA
jgi:hypothetical protein